MSRSDNEFSIKKSRLKGISDKAVKQRDKMGKRFGDVQNDGFNKRYEDSKNYKMDRQYNKSYEVNKYKNENYKNNSKNRNKDKIDYADRGDRGDRNSKIFKESKTVFTRRGAATSMNRNDRNNRNDRADRVDRVNKEFKKSKFAKREREANIGRGFIHNKTNSSFKNADVSRGFRGSRSNEFNKRFVNNNYNRSIVNDNFENKCKKKNNKELQRNNQKNILHKSNNLRYNNNIRKFSSNLRDKSKLDKQRSKKSLNNSNNLLDRDNKTAEHYRNSLNHHKNASTVQNKLSKSNKSLKSRDKSNNRFSSVKRLAGSTDREDNGIRIAAYIARAGYASRREAERLIEDQIVYINGKIVASPVEFVREGDYVRIGQKKIEIKSSKLWMYNKPRGEIVGVLNDLDREYNRRSIFDTVKQYISARHIIPIGRLDVNSEGLLLLTNDGGIAQEMMLPSNNYVRKYAVKVSGAKEGFDKLKSYAVNGVVIKGVRYKSFKIKLSRKNNISSDNYWYEISLFEGKNREVRNILSYAGLRVLRLLRVQFGNYRLGSLDVGQVEKVV